MRTACLHAHAEFSHGPREPATKVRDVRVTCCMAVSDTSAWKIWRGCRMWLSFC